MRLAFLPAFAALPLLAYACADHELYARQVAEIYARQAATTTSSAAASGTVSGTTSGSASSATQVSVSLISTNPTAVPLSLITALQSSSATLALSSTYSAGQTPSAIPNAPGLPDISSLSSSSYPTMDKTPPTDSDEVQQWIQEVEDTGVIIPNISVTVDSASCSGNAEAAADTSRCWWTCTGCTRDEDITECPTQYNWGVTYDDGPSFYTPNLLLYLDQQDIKTTFFTIGSRVLQFPNTARDEYMAGHQLGVHTWSHPPLTTMTNEQIIAEFGWTKKIMKDVLGVTPNTFRPPYGDIDDRVRAIALAMDLKPVIWTRLNPTTTFDTGDFNINAGTISSSEVISNWNSIMANASSLDTGFIVLEHDLYEQTVELATGYVLPEALAHDPKFNLTPVVTCQGLTMADAYVETNDNSSNPDPTFSSSTISSAQSTGDSSSSGSGSDSDSSGARAIVVPEALQALGTAAFAAIAGAGLFL